MREYLAALLCCYFFDQQGAYLHKFLRLGFSFFKKLFLLVVNLDFLREYVVQVVGAVTLMEVCE